MPRAAIDPPTKTCDHCGSTYHRKRNRNGHYHRTEQWRTQRYCSRPCANEARKQQAKTNQTIQTQTCQNCGTTYARPRYANGRLQAAPDWRARKYCSPACKTQAQTIQVTEKTCVACGATFTRNRHPNGKLQSSTAWEKQTTCSRECATSLRRKPKPERKQPIVITTHEPCIHCGKEVERRDGEKASRWQRRITCSTACAQARTNAHRRERAKLERSRSRLAPDGYVFNGKFPTPARVKSTWVSITGPDAPPLPKPERPARAMRGAKTAAALREATDAHPDLRAALLGLLTDSWVAMR